ncbi:MAG: DUF2085 domain-containing protein [Coriobacteriia bacterium]|nr:DUF2085 domain-containing protein [Coriobacteriia bacterium]
MGVLGTIGGWLQSVMLALGYGVCHQLPDRSFISGGFQQPVCARCSGIYIATTFGLVALFFLYRFRHRPTTSPDERLQVQLHWSYWVFLVLALGAMGYDGVSSYAHLRPTTDLIRLITGLAVGGALAPLLWALLNETLLKARESRKILACPRDWLLYLGTLVLAGLIDYLAGPVLGPVVPLLVTACLVATFTTIALVVLGLFKRFAGRVDRARDVVFPALIALVIALALLMLFALGKAALLSWLI